MADIRFVTKFLFNMKHDKNFYIINNEILVLSSFTFKDSF